MYLGYRPKKDVRWRLEAACSDYVSLWDLTGTHDRNLQIKICERCPVLDKCKEFAKTFEGRQTHKYMVLAGKRPIHRFDLTEILDENEGILEERLRNSGLASE